MQVINGLNNFRYLWVAFLSASIAVGIFGCGRYGPPLAPELLAPKPVVPVKITADATGVFFSWQASSHDTRGKELKTMDGYRIYRKIIKAQKDIVDNEILFDLISTVPDEHVRIREQLRAEARAQGKPGRPIEAPKSALKFTFTDTAVTDGKSYLYKLLPFNQGDVEGEARQLYLVAFAGPNSTVTKIDGANPDSDLEATDSL